MEKLEQHDGGDLATIVRLATMRRATVAEKLLIVRVRAPRLILHMPEAHLPKAIKNETR